MATTTNLGLTKPDIGSTDWGTDLNNNWDAIDDLADVVTNTFYVSKNGDDTNGNGSRVAPFLTIQKAFDTMGSAADATEFNDADKRACIVKVAPGVYTENLTVPVRPMVLVELDGALIEGNVTQTFISGYQTGNLVNTQLIIKAAGLRACYTTSSGYDSAHPCSGVNGNITIAAYSNNLAWNQLHLWAVGVTGDITFTRASGATGVPICQLYMNQAVLGGQIKTANSAQAYVWAYNPASNPGVGDACGIGGCNGKVSYCMLVNAVFSNDVDTDAAQNNCRWYGVNFVSGKTYDFGSHTGTVYMDANTYKEFVDQVTDAGDLTVGNKLYLLDDATGVAYDPGTAADWPTEPDDVAEALDEIAAGNAGGTANTVTTTDATTTTIATIAIPDDTAVLIEVKGLARRTDAADRAAYLKAALVYRESAGSATLEGSVQSLMAVESDTNWDLDIQVSGNNALIKVTGAAAKTINWRTTHTLRTVS